MKKAFAFVLVVACLMGGFLFGKNALAASITISQDTTWESGSVHVIGDGERLYVNSGVTLTMGPGAIVKFGHSGVIRLYGGATMRLSGSTSSPVILTSIKDDSVGGDTNGDGSATTPAPGDWFGFFGYSPITVDMSHAIIRYGGGMVFGEGDSIHIRDSQLLNNSGAIAVTGGISDFTINNSDIYNPDFCQQINGKSFCGMGDDIKNYSRASFDFSGNYWGSPLGPTLSYPHWLSDKGTRLSNIAGGNPIYQPYKTEPIWGKPAEPNPVILIPGMLGSWEISGHWKIDPIFHVYDNLMEALISAGYKEPFASTEKGNLFSFPYNWRQSNTTTAELLKAKIAEVRAITGKDKVDLVAHSMGGIVARQYIESDDYQNDVGKMIFVATPHAGSVDAYLKYEGAEFMGGWGLILKSLVQLEATENSYLDLLSYIRDKIPTVGQLLPSYSYLKDYKFYGGWQLRTYPFNYPSNSFLNVLNQTANLDKLKQRVEVTNIFGNLGATSTISDYKVVADPNANDNKWHDGYPENLDTTQSGVEYGEGDGTVPLSSADSLAGVKTIENFTGDHLSLPTVTQQDIIETLTGTRPEKYFHNNWLVADTKRWVFFRVYSPVDFNLVSPDGKRIGKDFATGQVINEIPNAFYSGFDTNEEFVFIPEPLDGLYKVNIQGVAGGGDYTFAGSFVDESQPTSNREVQISSAILDGGEDSLTIDNSATGTAIESDVDFQKMIEITNNLFTAGEIKKEATRKNLANEFGRLDQKYDKIINSQKGVARKLDRLEITLEVKVTNELIKLGAKTKLMTQKASDILLTNLNLLIDKLN